MLHDMTFKWRAHDSSGGLNLLHRPHPFALTKQEQHCRSWCSEEEYHGGSPALGFIDIC